MIKVNDESSVIRYTLKTSENIFSGSVDSICSDVTLVELIHHIMLVFLFLTQTMSSFHCLYLQYKKEFSIKDFFSKSDQFRSFLRIWSCLLKKSLKENLSFAQWLLTVYKIWTLL